MESRELIVMREMAWERAKGELNGMLATYSGDKRDIEKYHKFNNNYKSFVKYVEDNNLEE